MRRGLPVTCYGQTQVVLSQSAVSSIFPAGEKEEKRFNKIDAYPDNEYYVPHDQDDVAAGF